MTFYYTGQKKTSKLKTDKQGEAPIVTMEEDKYICMLTEFKMRRCFY